jgi:hypothetical protein
MPPTDKLSDEAFSVPGPSYHGASGDTDYAVSRVAIGTLRSGLPLWTADTDSVFEFRFRPNASGWDDEDDDAAAAAVIGYGHANEKKSARGIGEGADPPIDLCAERHLDAFVTVWPRGYLSHSLDLCPNVETELQPVGRLRFMALLPAGCALELVDPSDVVNRD